MSTPLPVAVPAPGQARTSMDELMLAMDIVDTLRHEQSLVERELAADERDENFVARVKQIYASQGIQVTDALIRQGVEALKQDRFVYQPPQRTFAVRMAEAWVDRWRWGKRALITGFAVGIAWLVVALPNRLIAEREYRAYTNSVKELQRGNEALVSRNGDLAQGVARLSVEHPKVIDQPLENARQQIEVERAALAPKVAALSTVQATSADEFAAAPEESYTALAEHKQQLQDLEPQVKAVWARVNAGEALISGANKLEQVESRLAGLTLGERAQETIATHRAQAAAALQSGDAAAAAMAVQALERAAVQVNLAYNLRIVSRSGVKSGVWRYHEDAPDGKNYYVVVEAIDVAGNALMLPVLNEETQVTQSVALFALRVPQSEYERVKADKLDNGLIDDARVGEKRRGELDVDYHIAVAGGTITDW